MGQGVSRDIEIYGAARSITCAEMHLQYVRIAAREFMSAGGAA